MTVVEIDPGQRFVIARWNGNTPHKYRATQMAKWRITKPQPNLYKRSHGLILSDR